MTTSHNVLYAGAAVRTVALAACSSSGGGVAHAPAGGGGAPGSTAHPAVAVQPASSELGQCKKFFESARTGPLGGKSTPVSGVGDEAYWIAAAPGASPPDLSARKGSLTCRVQMPAEPSVTTIGGSGQISDAAAAAFAAKMGVLCNDLFAAGS